QTILNGDPITIVGYNSPRQTVVAGEVTALGLLSQRARGQGWQASLLPVSHAFHTPLVAAAVPLLAEQLDLENFDRLEHPVVSTIPGEPLAESEDLRALLCRQVTSPVRFASAFGVLLDTGKGGRKESANADAKTQSILHSCPSPLDPQTAHMDLLIEV